MTLVADHRGAGIESALVSHLGGRRISRLAHAPSPSRSSFSIDEVDVLLDDGSTLELVAKAVHWDALLPEGQAAKPGFLWNPERERSAYEALLSRIDVGTARYYGSFASGSGVRYLLLERVHGVPIWQRGDGAAWRAAARWLARFHARIGSEAAARSSAGPHLLRYDGGFYERWAARCATFHGEAPALRAVLAAHARLVPFLLTQPSTFIHGEFYPANVLVEAGDAAAATRIRPVDWEMAAIGPPLMDLACLLAGRWSDDQRADVADAYFAEQAREAGAAIDRAALLRTLDVCLVHLSIRNLGWSRAWAPPPDRAFDWLPEAQRLCSKWNY